MNVKKNTFSKYSKSVGNEENVKFE